MRGVHAAGSDRARRAPRAASRLALLLAALAIFAVTAVAGRAFLADLYAGYGDVRQRGGTPGPVTLRASELARGLAPWRAVLLARYGESLAAHAGLAAAEPVLAQALARAPGDAFVWRYKARTLQRHGEFGAPLLRVLERTQALAPNARGLQLAAAIDGLYYWRHAGPELQQFWLARMRQAVHRDERRFLRAVIRSEREQIFCGYVGTQLKLRRWCGLVARYRAHCNSGETPKGQLEWCRRNALLWRQPRG